MASASSSVVVALPIDRWSDPNGIPKTFEGGGLTFWDGPRRRRRHRQQQKQSCPGDDKDGNHVDDDNDVPPLSLFSVIDKGGAHDDCATLVAHLCEKVEDAEMHLKLQQDLTHHLYHKCRSAKREDEGEQTS